MMTTERPTPEEFADEFMHELRKNVVPKYRAPETRRALTRPRTWASLNREILWILARGPDTPSSQRARMELARLYGILQPTEEEKPDDRLE
jgi:hypothetical protein